MIQLPQDDLQCFVLACLIRARLSWYYFMIDILNLLVEFLVVVLHIGTAAPVGLGLHRDAIIVLRVVLRRSDARMQYLGKNG